MLVGARHHINKPNGMDAVRRRRSKGGAPISSGNLSDAAPAFRIFLSLYQTPPTDDIELEKFERYALDRLQCSFLGCFLY